MTDVTPLRTRTSKRRVLIFIVAYNAERTVEQVLKRIPSQVFQDERFDAEILVIDDASADATFERAHRLKERGFPAPVTVLQNPVNLGYGGNQKLGYRFALENGFDFVALLHGDGQYAPEELPRLLEPLLQGESDAVFGSRMITPGAARRGGMPLYKYIGNKILTSLQNRIVGTRLSEYHSGYRLYSCRALSALPFETNSDGFDFDTDIIIQLHLGGFRIRELPVPTFYGDEICHVNGLQYAAAIVWTSLLARIQQLGLLYDRRFDVRHPAAGNRQYRPKFDFRSSHSMALECVEEHDSLLLLGSGPAPLVTPFAAKASRVTATDVVPDPELRHVCDRSLQADLDDCDFEEATRDDRVTRVLALDVIEHLRSPEDFLKRLRETVALQGATFVLTTANVAFLPVRLMLLVGQFNYGRSGILDRTHTRLLTFSSFRRLLQQAGFEVLELRGIPAPFPLALGRSSRLARWLLKLNDLLVRVWPAAFSYQIFVVARPLPTTRGLLRKTVRHSKEKVAHPWRSTRVRKVVSR
ncbi:MAG: glycosyltransferase [Longimicrobiales bacterium]|nr:glycosyltransferase [Longimicrobiales bacterium]